ncbi:hypothetical protein [uncultured Clostridium sp.]|uniref:hypothetical protein n=1 Tax=uncultured Clostridium sp. TaxID=59620 RepID=UPI002633CA8D|nr:hypothetical protein [uncultured Clostridium sp.]
MENTTTRVTIRVSQKIKKYFEDKSIETGVAQSSLMALAMEEYIDQKNMIKFSTNIENYMAEAQKINDSTSAEIEIK